MTELLVELRPAIQGVLAFCAGVYVLGAWWFWGGMKLRSGSNQTLPAVSIVLAVRDEAVRIGRCLQALRRQDYPPERYEIIVVDDGSTDGTGQLVQQLGDARLTLLSTQDAYGRSGSKKAALTLGIEAAAGELILTTDADCLAPAGWVRGMVQYFEPQTGMVIGFSQIGAPGTAYGARTGYEAVDFLCLMGCILGSVGRWHPMAASGQNLAYRKALFEQVGGYARVAHRASGDDVLLLQMARRFTDWKIAFATAPDTFVVHPPASSWRGLFQQRTRWASNAPYQVHFDPLFLGYMVVAFALSVLLALSPFLLLSGGLTLSWAAGIWAFKAVAEYRLFSRAARFFQRPDLRRFFPLWMLVQPLHIAVVGLLGCLGIFTWKGQRHRWGRREMGKG